MHKGPLDKDNREGLNVGGGGWSRKWWRGKWRQLYTNNNKKINDVYNYFRFFLYMKFANYWSFIDCRGVFLLNQPHRFQRLFFSIFNRESLETLNKMVDKNEQNQNKIDCFFLSFILF